jgi:hypothetical protein
MFLLRTAWCLGADSIAIQIGSPSKAAAISLNRFTTNDAGSAFFASRGLKKTREAKVKLDQKRDWEGES